MKTLIAVTVVAGFLIGAVVGAADAKAKPYPLTTCVVSGEKFGGDMGDPYVHVYKGQEVTLCCKGCLKDFNKDADKYLKTIQAAAKKKEK